MHFFVLHSRSLDKLTSKALSVGAKSVKAPSLLSSSARPDSRMAATNLQEAKKP